MTWLLTGGAGYIGAHIVRALQAVGKNVVVLDDLSNGFAENVPTGVPMVHANVLATDVVEKALRHHAVTGVVHLAAKKAVGESVERPLWYYEQNVIGTYSLLTAMERVGVDRLLFSSSAATYGEVGLETLNEETPTVPTSPYGETKLVGEWMIRDQAVAKDLSYACLRYFNVAGAGEPALGDRGVNNLIPLVFRALSNGQAPKVFGADYDTRDGSCIRDYIHVTDLADAHAAAAAFLDDEARAGRRVARNYNVGTGTGTTVLEVIDAVRELTGRAFEAEVVGRRAGDPPRVVASAERITRELGWQARYDVRDMVASAWAAWQLHPPTN